MTSSTLANLLKLVGSARDGALLRFSLGNEYLKLGDRGNAILQLQESVTREPGYSAAWKLLGRASLLTGIAIALTLVVGTDVLARAVVQNGLFDLPYSLGVVRALPLFVTGMMIARLVERAPLSKPVAVWGGLAAGAGLVALQIAGRFDMASVGLIALIVLCAGSVPVTRPIPMGEAAGKLSFSLFITHLLVAAVWFGVLHDLQGDSLPAWTRWALWAGSLPAALIAAMLFDRFVDQPVQSWIAPRLKSWFSPRPARYPEPAPSA